MFVHGINLTILVLIVSKTEELYNKCASVNRQWSSQKVIIKQSLIYNHDTVVQKPTVRPKTLNVSAIGKIMA